MNDSTLRIPGKRGAFKNPEAPERVVIHQVLRKSLLDKLDEFCASLNPPMHKRYFLREYFYPQFEDFLEKWLEFHKPEPGERVSVERINIFPAVLVERTRRIWRKK